MRDRLYLVSVVDVETGAETSLRCHERLPLARGDFDRRVSEAVNAGGAQRVDHSDYAVTVTYPDGSGRSYQLLCASPARV